MIAAFQRIFLGRQDAVEKQVRQRKRFSDVREWIPVVLVQGLLFATIWAITGHWWLYSLLWLLPILTLLAGLSATRACLEHADQASHANRWITFQAGFFERQILGPANFNYHAEHHLHAALPACHLPALHRAVLESPLKSELVIEKGYMRRLVGLCRRMAQERKGVSSASSAANPGL